jgi:Tfp pilus assembly protein PilF
MGWKPMPHEKPETRNEKPESCMPQKTPRQTLTTPQLIQLVLLGIIAFSTGGILVWLVLSSSRTSSLPPVQAPPVAAHALAGRPDVSQLDLPQAALTLGNWHFDQKAWPQAISEYERAIQLGIDNPDVRTDLGSAYRFSGATAKALEQYEIARRQNPQHENSLFNLATLYLQSMNDSTTAVRYLEEFQRRFPSSGARPRVEELLRQARSAVKES